jgi:alpha-ribazole phosphatase
LVRHGETHENSKKVYYGKIDAVLNENGKNKIIEISEYLKEIKFDKVYISERKRTEETATLIVNKNVQLIIDKRINELDFGDFEGKSYEELSIEYPEQCEEWEKNWQNFTPNNGESYKMMYNRVREFIYDIEKDKVDNILIVTHGGVIKTFYSYIMGENLDVFWKFSCSNGCIAHIKYEYGNWFIEEIRK